MSNKEKAIESLISVARWMENSSFDYQIKDLKDIFDEVLNDYKQYLSNDKEN